MTTKEGTDDRERHESSARFWKRVALDDLLDALRWLSLGSGYEAQKATENAHHFLLRFKPRKNASLRCSSFHRPSILYSRREVPER